MPGLESAGVRGALALTGNLALRADPPVAGEPAVTVLFVGGAAGDDSSPTLNRLARRLETLDPKRGLVVFTGNYSDAELPAEGEEGRVEAEGHVLAHEDNRRGHRPAGLDEAVSATRAKLGALASAPPMTHY